MARYSLEDETKQDAAALQLAAMRPRVALCSELAKLPGLPEDEEAAWEYKASRPTLSGAPLLSIRFFPEMDLHVIAIAHFPTVGPDLPMFS